MQLNKNHQSLIYQLLQLNDEQIKRDYLNHLKWTDNISEILQLVDDKQALRLVKLGFDDSCFRKYRR